ncbi:MAG: HYR domain-containing protein, partial [Bacteroidales bacterium]|nr:HYR domain-containing protein [Bacteroidales bacterium]
GVCTYTVTTTALDPVTTGDNCSVTSVVNDYNGTSTLQGAVFPIGTTTVVWTVTDGSGNIGTCTYDVVVIDTELPTILCPPKVTAYTDPGSCFATNVDMGIPVVSDNCSILIISNNAPAVFPIGSTIVTWTVTDGSGNMVSCNQIVSIEDIEIPTIVCPSDLTVNTDSASCSAMNVNLGNPMVDDNCGIFSVTNNAPQLFQIGITIVTWTVTDNGGNIATCEQIVTVEDNEIPSIVCPADITVSTDTGVCIASNVNLGTPIVYDNCTLLSIINDAPAEFPIGTTTVTWIVTDASGNTSSCQQTVTVEDNEIPSIVCPSDITSCTDSIVLTNPIVADNCGIASLSNDAPAVFPYGQTIVTWTVTDFNGNITQCFQSVYVSQLEVLVDVSSQVSCYNSSDAVLTVNVSGGIGAMSYSLNGGILQSSNLFSNLPSGSYVVEAIDANGCSALSDTIIVANADSLSASVQVVNHVTCFDGNDATITVTASGGTGTYTYSLNGGVAQTSNVFTGLTEGSYSVTVLDENNCQLTLSGIVVENANPIIVTAEQVYNECFSTVQGQILIEAYGGTAPYEYSIDGGLTFHNNNYFNSLLPGFVYLVVKDANGCTSETMLFTIVEVPDVKIQVNTLNANNCFGVEDVVVEVVILEGGVAPFLFSMNGSVADSINIFTIGAGQHTVTVYDNSGCINEYNFFIESAEPIQIDLLNYTDANCLGTDDGSLEIEVTGGTSPYSYEWSNNFNTSSIYNLPAGEYTVSVTDDNNCLVESNFVIVPGTVEVELILNNAFSPNSDGINDYWVLENLELYPNNELVVLNRWGNEIYTAKPYNNDWNGSQLSEGTYFYILKVNMCGEDKVFNNYVTIIR